MIKNDFYYYYYYIIYYIYIQLFLQNYLEITF